MCASCATVTSSASRVAKTSADRTVPRVLKKHNFKAEDIDWFLPHYSSDYFRKPLMEGLAKVGLDIPEEKWFTNLPHKGNTGSASFYIILEELLSSGKLKPGHRLLLFIPESGRFSHCFMQLTVV